MDRPFWVVRVRADGSHEFLRAYTRKGDAKRLALVEHEACLRWPDGGLYSAINVTREGETLLSYPIAASA